jgi:hypothetical protein
MQIVGWDFKGNHGAAVLWIYMEGVNNGKQGTRSRFEDFGKVM